MPGLTQQDVTPVIPQVEDVADEEKKDDEGYQWGRWLTKPGNELKNLGNQLTDFVKRRNANVQSTGNVGILRIYTEKDRPGLAGSNIRYGALPLEREGTQGVVEATANVGLAGVNLGQNIVEQVAAPIQGREPEPQDPEQTLLGRPLAGLKEASANFLDVPQRYELPESDRLLRDMSGEVAVATALALLMGKTPLNPTGSSTAFTGTKLNPLTSPSLKELVNTRGPLAALFRTKNAARLRPLLRWGSALGVESMLTTALIDNRETPYADPGDDQTRAALKSLIPQAGFDFALAGGLFGAGKGVEKAFQLPDLFKSIARNNKSHNTVNDVGRARTWAEESGLQQRNGEGSYEFIADEKPSPTADAPKNPREAIDLMESSWDSSLPEVDVAVRGLDQLDDEGLTAIASRPPEQPIAEALGEQLNRQQQMRQAQEQLRQVAEARSQQRGFGSDVAEEAPVAPDVEVAPNAPAVEPPQQVLPDQEMFEAIDVPQLQGIAKFDVNVGAELAKAGTSPTQATRRELIDAILKVRQKNAGAASPISAPPSAMPAAQRNEVKKQVIRQAINEGQLRPSATEAPEIPTATTKDIDDMAPFEALDEELRLKDEYQKLDNAKAERIINETREAEGYYQMSPEEQILNGKLDGWEEPSVQPRADLEAAGRDINKVSPGRLQGNAESLQQWVNSGRPEDLLPSREAAFNVIQGKGQVLNLDKAGIDMAEALNDRAMGKSTPATEAVRKAYMDFYGLKDKPRKLSEQMRGQLNDLGQSLGKFTRTVDGIMDRQGADLADRLAALDAEQKVLGEMRPPEAQPEFVMPQAYAKSKPTFGQAQLKFESDLDRAAYMLQSKTTGAKADKKREVLFAALEERGISRREALDLGAEVKASIQDGIEDATGSRKAPQQRIEIEVPASTRDADQDFSIDLPNLPDKPAQPMEERFAQAINGRVQQLETELTGVAKQLFGDDLPDFNFKLDPEEIVIPKAWGGDGIETAQALGNYKYGGLSDVITINNLMNGPRSTLRTAMFHESWHRIQRGYLKPKELKVLDNVFGQTDLANWSKMSGGQRIKQTEVQAVAFQEYAAMRDRGEARTDVIRQDMIAQLEEYFPEFKGWKKKLTANAFTILAEGWERIRAFAVRGRNLIAGNGYQNVYDIFHEAYDGKLTQGRRFEDATRTIDEVMGMAEGQFDELRASGRLEEVDVSLDEAIERERYFNKWKGKANTVLNSIDTEIAALKQLATQGGC